LLVPRERVRAAMGSRSWACGAGVGAGLRVLAGTVVHWSWRGAGCAGGGSTPGVGAPGCTPGVVGGCGGTGVARVAGGGVGFMLGRTPGGGSDPVGRRW
jgi:hypothetical protein